MNTLSKADITSLVDDLARVIRQGINDGSISKVMKERKSDIVSESARVV
jgi:hypothetical protein